jgi:F420-dependent oxidoreductase-like protein
MRMPIVYCWTILTGATADVPRSMGVCRERVKAVSEAEAYLLRGEGFLANVEAVRPSISVYTMNPCYERTGIAWLGRRTRSGTVYWSRLPDGTPGEPMRKDGAMKLRIFTEPQQGASYATLRNVAKATEDLGFDGFFRSDHYLKMGGVSGLPGPTDAWATLAALAAETSRVRLGTLMTCATFRLPGPLAITVAQVDEMSGGRVEFGLGAGWYEAEHTAYGIPFPSMAERFGKFEEQLAVITGLWETPAGETFSYEGSHYRLVDSPALPKPAQHPRPPVIIGGTGPRRTPALAARYADEFNVPFHSAAESGALYERVRSACSEAGRDPSSMVFSAAQVVCCGRNSAQLSRRAAAIGRDLSDLRENGLAGTPEEIVEKIGSFAAVGVSRLYLQVLDLSDLEHLELIAAQVSPAAAPAVAATPAAAAPAVGATPAAAPEVARNIALIRHVTPRFSMRIHDHAGKVDEAAPKVLTYCCYSNKKPKLSAKAEGEVTRKHDWRWRGRAR